jgi:hypothetical protein
MLARFQAAMLTMLASCHGRDQQCVPLIDSMITMMMPVMMPTTTIKIAMLMMIGTKMMMVAVVRAGRPQRSGNLHLLIEIPVASQL